MMTDSIMETRHTYGIRNKNILKLINSGCKAEIFGIGDIVDNEVKSLTIHGVGLFSDKEDKERQEQYQASQE